MEVIKTDIEGVVIIEPKIFGDARGYFYESFNAAEFEAKTGIKTTFVQDNQSKSSYGVLRGLHFQKPPYAQSKLVRVVEGAVVDVAVDIRRGSPTFGKYVAVPVLQIQLGVELATKYRESKAVIHAIESHHNDVEPSLLALPLQISLVLHLGKPQCQYLVHPLLLPC